MYGNSTYPKPFVGLFEVCVQFVSFQAILGSICTNLGAFSGSCRTRANSTVLWTRQYGKGTSRYASIPNLAAAAGTCLPNFVTSSLLYTHVSCTTAPSVRSPIFGDNVLKFTVEEDTVDS